MPNGFEIDVLGDKPIAILQGGGLNTPEPRTFLLHSYLYSQEYSGSTTLNLVMGLPLILAEMRTPF